MQISVRTLLLSVLLPVLVLVAIASPVAATGGGLVSGKVFLDANRNLQAEPSEATIAGATVNIESISDPNTAYQVTADANGNYLMRNLPYGQYKVWVEVETGKESKVMTATVSEVNGAVALDLPVQEHLATPEPSGALRIFLPTLLR